MCLTWILYAMKNWSIDWLTALLSASEMNRINCPRVCCLFLSYCSPKQATMETYHFDKPIHTYFIRWMFRKRAILNLYNELDEVLKTITAIECFRIVEIWRLYNRISHCYYELDTLGIVRLHSFAQCGRRQTYNIFRKRQSDVGV